MAEKLRLEELAGDIEKRRYERFGEERFNRDELASLATLLKGRGVEDTLFEFVQLSTIALRQFRYQCHLSADIARR